MNFRNIIEALGSNHFSKIENQGNWFEKGSIIYTREIRENVFAFRCFKKLKS